MGVRLGLSGGCIVGVGAVIRLCRSGHRMVVMVQMAKQRQGGEQAAHRLDYAAGPHVPSLHPTEAFLIVPLALARGLFCRFTSELSP